MSAEYDLVPAYEQNTGETFVWLCELCGQTLDPGYLCNSSIHVGPGEQANGRAIKSVDLAERCTSAEAQLNHAFAFLRLILNDPYDLLPPGVLDAMRELTQGDSHS